MVMQAAAGTHSVTEGIPSKGNGATKRPPPGDDGVNFPFDDSEIENNAQAQATDGADYEDEDEQPFDEKPTDKQFLELVTQAQAQAQLYSNQVNRRSWERVYKAFHQEHFNGSKYTTNDFKNRSKLFIPKTRAAIRKDLAAVSASLFGTLDAVSCMAGNEGDPMQRASAAVIQELVNYRTDRNSPKDSIPWFHVALGARQTSQLTGICLSKQSWKLELKRKGTEKFNDEESGEERLRDVWVPKVDRPDIQLIPPECFVIDPAADWTCPAQDAAYVIIKWPMRIDEIRRKQRDPRRPWNEVSESVLKGAADSASMDMAAIRRSREQGLDRFDETNTGDNFDIVWVYETFMRTAGEDWTFISVGDSQMLTDPAPVEEVYPEQFGDRPITLGYGSFEAFRIFPMSNAESWQMLQMESNDLRNLTLDAIKQNVMPVTKVVRGRQVDLDQLKRRGQGTAIMVTSKDDVTWEKAPDVSAAVQVMKQQLDIEFDDLAGQQNYGTVQDNNALGKTLGGLKLAAGSANAVQEFDIRVWIETWCEPVLMQLVRLEQYYESDPIVLGLCGERAQLMQKHGINEISDELLENTVNIRVNIGLGAGDPQQRLQKFNSAVQVALPLLEKDPDFLSGKKQIDGEAVMSEVFGAAGYRDGGKRFVKQGNPQGPNPQQTAATNKDQTTADLNKARAKAVVITALAAAAKVGLGLKEIENDWVNSQFTNHLAHMDQVGKAHDKGQDDADRHLARQNAARGVNPDGTPLVPPDAAAAGGTPDDVPPMVPTPKANDVPAADPGQQAQQDAAAGQAQLAKAVTPKKRNVKITSRGPDGRASGFEVTEE